MTITVRTTTTPIKAPASIDNLLFTTYTDDKKGSFVYEIDPVNRQNTLGILNAQSRARLYSSTDGMLTGTLIRDFNIGVADSAMEVMGVKFMPNGEALVTCRNNWSLTGGIYVSQGWRTNPATATWTRTLTYSATGNFCQPYSWSVAPKGHVREGLVVVTEYGGQSTQGTTSVEGGASRVWVSLDYGKTWREIFNLLKTYGTKNQHMHGVAYDPWTDNILMCFGDGYAGAPAVSGALYSDDWLKPSPTWKPIIPVLSTAAWQVTLFHPTPAGVICGSDGGPDGVWFMARDPAGGYQFPKPVITNLNGSCIGTMVYAPDPNRPALMVYQNGQAETDPTRVLMISPRGDQIDEVYCDTQEAPKWGNALTICGPDRDGYVYWTANDGRSVRTLTRGVLNFSA